MGVVTVRQLLEAGVHFGHQTRRWNPKMKRYIWGERNGIYILDLQQTVGMLERAYEFVENTVASGGTVLFVGTKKQAQEAVEQQAMRVGMPYVNFRWLGGMLTNFETIKTRLTRLRELEDMVNDGTIELLTKKEGLLLTRELDKLQRNLGGIRTMTKLPSAIWVVDTVKEHIAVAEANRLGIPVVAVVDTNCDPDVIDYVIPGNDDAIRSGALLTHLIADACATGYARRAARTSDDVVAEQAAAAAASTPSSESTEAPAAPAQPAAEPLAEWEIALQQEEAASAAAAAGASSAEADQADQAAADQAAAEPAETQPTEEPAPAAPQEEAQA
ncbi:SSU ribosomal protein S2p (SAe) [Euzebya pacifica]|uniref:Small ribosomal subunit protein uS2 n=1 Tax=Euzebya pacifica TaxID=1608957 RepID=A0A346Y0T7_9ACTN|nr:30S ribosomal protein S2 [Euzebya pacifica]AXV08084.1 SSU ribosomal protein S2p (SAe) [Euzebya pacifica]